MKKAFIKIVLYISLLFAFGQLYGQASEYKLKAVYLERFTRFVEWPDLHSEFSDTTNLFVITVIGENPFKKALEDLYTTTRIKNKKVKINYITNISDIDSCHILFISSAMENSLADILKYTKTKAILTVSDHKGFADQGVIINFYIANNKLRFEINESSLIQSKLYMSYLLLNVATIVKDKDGDK